MEGKAKVKGALQKELGLVPNAKIPLIGMVTRLASQKGLDLVVEALPSLMRMGVQLVILGSGDRSIEQALQAGTQGSDSVRLQLGFDNPLAHRIYAGADLFLMPSRYEPCGLGQMISMRYGTIPIVRATGGLADTVVDVAGGSEKGNGFCFAPYEPKALVEALQRAVIFFREPKRFDALRRRVMGIDFSWKNSAKEYLALYENLLRL